MLLNKRIVLGTLLIMGILAILLSYPLDSANAASGTKDATPLQPIIDGSKSGEVLVLEPGMYAGPVSIDKSISIRGDSSVTVLNSEAESTITIRSDGVTLQGFTVQHFTNEPTAAIQVEGDRVEIRDLDIQSQSFGIVLRGSVDGLIHSNTISWAGPESASSGQKGNGIDLYNSHRNHIENNKIKGMRDGIYLENSRNLTVRGNTLLHTRYGIHCMYIDGSSVVDNVGENNSTGAMIMGVKNTVVSGNSFRKQSENVHSQGILLYDVHRSTIQNNVVEGNRVGMNIAESSGNEIRRNAVLRNFIGIQLVLAEDNQFIRNQFVSNVIEASAMDSRNNEMKENYWDSFQGLDLNDDGISELSYEINPFYEQVVNRNSAYQLFFQSPGMLFMSSLFTEGKEEWATDRSPLISMKAESLAAETGAQAVKETTEVWIIGCILLGMATFIMIYTGVLRK
ncbi:nitrous oxide reductase family maturation protein NosD [Paenibacillus sp. NPDC056933]|uniref:right-handed parallel beta-helix repeat-containing protein n=1 Tax=Paenibacillus sp. NPDC056933 TaxID=3345968 RepID=UPI003626F6BF